VATANSSNRTIELRIIMQDGSTQVTRGRTAFAILRLLKYENTINDTELRGKFWINLQGNSIETTLDAELA